MLQLNVFDEVEAEKEAVDAIFKKGGSKIKRYMYITRFSINFIFYEYL